MVIIQKQALAACFFLLVLITLLFSILSRPAHSQSFRFMDESGNIYFVDRLEDVPLKYRYQVLKPSPPPNPKAKVKKPPKKPAKKKAKPKKAAKGGLQAKVPPQPFTRPPTQTPTPSQAADTQGR